MGVFCKKIISIVLIIALLINNNITAFAQMRTEGLQYRPAVVNDLKSLVSQTIKSDIKVIDDKYIRRAYQKEYNFHELIKTLNEQGFSNEYGEVCDTWKGEIEGEKICAPYHTFMRGVIGALIDYSEGDGSIFINYTREIREAVFLGALASEDIKPMRELLKGGVKESVKSCGANYIPLVSGVITGLKEMKKTASGNLNIRGRDLSEEQKAQERCEKGLAGLTILSVVWEDKRQADESADLIYKTLKRHQTGKFGGLVLLEGIAALSYLDTDYSYSLIERFLTKDSIPGVREGLEKEIALFSPQGWYDVGEAGVSKIHKGGMRYLNMNSERWSYINEEETRKAGLDPDIIASQGELLLNKAHAGTSYNIVYGNLLTDIGEFLVQNNVRGKKLGDKLIDGFINDNKVVHLPLMLGLIKGKDGTHNIKASLAARKLNQAFYYDMNGGTGKYILKTSALKGSGLGWNHQNVMSFEYYKARVGVERFNFFADILISSLFLGTFILSVPNMMKGIYKLGKLAKLSIKGKAVKAGRLVKKKPAAKPTKPEVKATAPKTEPKAAAQPKTNVKPTTSKAEGALNKVRTSKKANNIFKKPYSQMNKVEKKIFDTYINLELGGLGDLKAAIKDSKSLLTTKTGLKATTTSGLTIGAGEAPAVEARLMAKAPTEVVTNIGKGKVLESPLTLFDRTGVNTQIGSSGRTASKMPNTFKVKTPKVKANLFNNFTGLKTLFTVPASAPLLVRLQKEKELQPFKIAAAITGATIGLTALNLLSIPTDIDITLAVLPFWASKLSVLQDKNPTERFFDLHKRFIPEFFKGNPLSEEEVVKMKEILGEDFFNLWQKYYNKDLNQFAKENPQDLEELIKYSGRYETALYSRIEKIYGGTNPLYVFAWRDITKNLVNNLLSGQTMENAIENLGKDVADYHYKVTQIKMLQRYHEPGYKLDWANFTNENYLKQISWSDMWFGHFRTATEAIENYVSDDNYAEYLEDMLKSSPSRERTYKGVELSTISKYEQIRFASISHPNFIKQKDIFFKVLQEDYDNIKPLIDKVQSGGELNSAEREKLDNNIADISYIFTNVIPFYRGTAASNLAIVYGLYQMAGIDAPLIKPGRALDLSAFSMTPEEYKQNWPNLFDGKFNCQ